MPDIRSSVVLITSSDPAEANFGSGFVVAHDGGTVVLTCAHVVRDIGGPEKVRISGQPATVVALDPDGWPDLAVLRTDAAADAPALELDLGGRRGDAFESAGFQLFAGHLIRRVSGRLEEQLGLEDARRGDRIRAFELALDGSDRLQRGYSGSPVVATATGTVLGVISHLHAEGSKGMAIAVEALRLIWPDVDRVAPMRLPRPATLSHGPALDVLRESTALFVGRQEELQKLSGKLTAMRDGTGSVGFVIGEAGMGKSTLALRLARKVLEETPDCLFTLARLDIVLSAHTTFAPFKSIMEQVLLSDQVAARGGDEVRPIELAAQTLRDMGIRRLGPLTAFTGTATAELQRMLVADSPAGGPTDDAGTDLGGFLDQGRLLDCYAEVLRRVAGLFPVVIVLDDIHWADDSSLLLLRHLGEVIETHRVLIIATYRPEEASNRPLLRDVIDQLCSLGAFSIDLQSRELNQRDPLGKAFCNEYLTARYGTQFSPQFLDLMASLTSGNPLFLAETLTNLEEKGDIVKTDGQWMVLRSADALSGLPTRLEHVISQRVNRLDQDLLTTLKLGSVEGEVFTAEVVAALQKVEDSQLLTSIVEKLIRAHRLLVAVATRRMVSGRSLHTFGFRHVLTQRYIYEYLLSNLERQILHEQLAACLEQLYGTTARELLPRLATHYSLADVPDKTMHYALLAGEQALTNYGWSEAAKFGRLGIRMLDGHPDFAESLPIDERIRLRLLYAKAEIEGGIIDEPIDHAQAGLDTLLLSTGYLDAADPKLAIEVYLTLGRLTAVKTFLTDFHSNEYVKRAITLAEQSGDKRAMIQALTIQYVTTNVADQSMAAEQLAARKRCVELAEELGDPIVLADTLQWLAVHYVVFDTDADDPLALAQEYGTRALRIAERQNIITELSARIALSWIYHHRGQYGEQLETFRRDIVELAAAHGQTVLEGNARTDLSHYYSFFVGAQDTALQLKREAYELRVRLGRQAVINAEHLAELLFRLGRFEESRELLGQYLAVQDDQRAARARGLMARALAVMGRDDEALTLLAELERVVTQANLNMIAPVHGAAILAYLALGRPQDALRHAEWIIPTIPAAGRRGQFWTYMDFPTLLAETYRMAGDLNAATEWARTSARYWAKLSSVTDVSKLVMFAEHEFVLGKVSADSQRWSEARPLVERSRAAFGASEHYLLAEALLVLAVIARGDGDTAGSRALALDAARLAGELGLPSIARRAQAIIDD